ncbi:SDR family oxidoreductase [Candidatus Margulisiibacteriota bacterium]
MKILITGGGGMLATDIEAYYEQQGKHEIIAPRHAELDVLDTAKIHQAVSEIKPDVIFHTAAYHVNDCEDKPETAYHLNGWAAGQLAKAARKNDAVLVYISTCGLFGDEVRAYSEYDQVVLKTEYARSKYAGEILAQKECEKIFVVRPGWLFGGSIKHNKNFVYQRYLEAMNKPLLQSAGDKHGSPTYTADLITRMDELVLTNDYGIYHVSNQGGATRAGYIQKIIEACGLKTPVEPVDSSHFPRKANVPDCEILHNWNLKYLGLTAMPPWEDAIERFVKVMLKEMNN